MPLKINVKCFKDEELPLSDPTLRQLVGSLTMTISDIAHAVHVVSKLISSIRQLDALLKKDLILAWN